MPEPEGSVHTRINHTTSSDYGAGAGKGGTVLGIAVPELKLAAPVFGAQARKLSGALTTLITALDGLGEPWGKDAGAQFEERYKANQRAIESSAGTLVLGLVSIHEAMDDLKDGHVDNEEVIKGIFTKVAPKKAARDGDGGEHGG
ncbi:hypothetical protein HMPREF1486_02520 [Streptomyces sp. HPH0547]|uniref:WXG100 family type VII secretion target n=1 Tax=Streptomyces TaxID=1883 RepID=UPI00034E2698|nr:MULTISPECIES: hypothetical protein [Streptomyces]EPD94706.1 hypothetical protein HMPREF1486_02520 [Streptomyces sp. HPH0547]UVN55129.1 hypothetical protein NR995_11810 [Streptomyces albus]